jgi:hypothetical protein
MTGGMHSVVEAREQVRDLAISRVTLHIDAYTLTETYQ